jgi:MFS family permease
LTSVSLLSIAGIVVITRKPDVHREANVERPLTQDENRSQRFLHLAWVANFATYFTIGIIRSLFPKLGGQLGMSSPSIGALLSAITFTQVLIFALLARTSSWHYRLAPLLVSESILLAGSLLIYVGTGFGQFLLPMVMAGGCAGIAYFSSIYYSINRPARLGARSGLHEALIGLGVVAGPLTGGIVAQRWNLRSPYLLSALVVLLGIGSTAWIGMMLRSKQEKEPENGAGTLPHSG